MSDTEESNKFREAFKNAFSGSGKRKWFSTPKEPAKNLPFFIPPPPPPTKEISSLYKLLNEIEGWQFRDPEMFKQHLLLLSQQATKYAEEIEKK